MGIDLGDVAAKEKVSNESRNEDSMLQQHLTTISYILGEFFASAMANAVDCGGFGSCLQSLDCLDLNWIN